VIAARLLLTASLLCGADAAAHAELVGSTPEDGAHLARAPSTVELRFNEPVTPLALRLFGSSGTPVVLRTPLAPAEMIRVELPPEMSEGSYTLSYRVISLDSHPVAGSIAFAVGEAGATTRPATERDALRAWRIAVRALRDFALLIATGGALFLLAVARFPGDRKLLVTSALMAATAAVLGASLQGAAMLGPGTAPWSEEAWHAGIHSSFGLSTCVATGAALLIAIGAMAHAESRRLLLALGALAAVASFPLTGHAASTRLGVLGPVALSVHVLAAGFWAGSLFALFAGPSAVSLRRFSRLGIVAVASLVLGGVTFAVMQLHSLAEVTGSEYGRLIVGKATLLAGLLVLASLNRYRFLPKLEHGDAAASRRLRASIAGEIVLMACVMTLTALLVQTPPPRDAGFVASVQAMGRVAEISVSPARAGHNSVTVRFRDADPAEVVLELGNPQAGVEPVARPMRRDAPGYYRWEGAELLFGGTWSLEVQALIGDFDRAIFRAEVPVR
jgi:copper transport protein